MPTEAPPSTLISNFVTIVVTLVWAIVFIVTLYTREYDPLIYVSPPMGLVIGYVTGIRILRRVNGDT